MISSYKLEYTRSFPKDDIEFNCTKGTDFDDICERNSQETKKDNIQILLTQITYKGLDGQGEQRPYRFCYTSMSDATSEVCQGTDTTQNKENATPNDIYLTKVDNGYGGLINYTYEYKGKVDRICGIYRDGENSPWQKVCTDAAGVVPVHRSKNTYSSYYVVKTVVADNGQGQSKKTTYEYIGISEAYGELERKIEQGLVEFSKVKDMQFLGYPVARAKVEDTTNHKLLSYTEDKTHLSIENRNLPTEAGCFMPDPRYGQSYETNILNENGQLVGYTKII